VGQNKFAKKGKFLNFELVGNGRKGKRKRLNGKEMKEKDGKLRKWEGWEEGTESMRKGALGGFEKENKKMRGARVF
jgi:hypothetical protein